MRYATRLAALGLALVAALAAHAQPAVPPLTGRVMDHAGVLAPSTEQVLAASLAAHEDATGNQVVVLTVPSLEGETVEAFALRVFNTWGLGQAERDNGVLVLISRDDRTMRIEVGYGLEGALTDARAGRIIRSTFIPSFRNQDYDTGTHAGVNAVLGTLDGTYEPPADDDGTDAPWAIRIIFGFTHVLLPGLFGFFTLFYDTGWLRYGLVVFLLAFIGSGGMLILSPSYGWMLALVFLLLYILADVYMSRSEKWSRVRKQVTTASRKGKKTRVTVGGVSFFVGGAASGGSGGGFSSGGGGRGGGFSGGGGSSGGGGASGSW